MKVGKVLVCALGLSLALGIAGGAMADSVTAPLSFTGHFVPGQTASLSLDLGQRFSQISSIRIQHSGTAMQNYDPLAAPGFQDIPIEASVVVAGLQDQFISGYLRPGVQEPFAYAYDYSSPASDAYSWSDQSKMANALQGHLDLTFGVWSVSSGVVPGYYDVDSMSVTVEGTFTSVPEPSSIAALLLGVSAMGGVLLRRRK